MALPLLLVACVLGCERLEVGGLSQLTFHPDTLRFDSVFAGSISSTRLLRVRNAGGRPVRLDRVALADPDGQYALLMDGQASGVLRHYELAPGDSLLIAVRIKPQPGGGDTVTVLSNAISLTAGEAERSVPIRGKGLMVADLGVDTLRADWHLAGPPARVVARTLYVPRGVTLRISGNASLYFRAGAGLVVDGALVVEGSAACPVVFAGERLETYYRRKPGQWAGIHLRAGSGPHALRWAEVRGAVCGVRADSLPDAHPLVVEHARLLFNSLEGIDAGYSRVVVRSSLLAQNYRHAVRLRNAHAEITHSTLYGVSAPPQVRMGSLLAVRHDERGAQPSFSVRNSIVWGDRESEVEPELRAEHAAGFVLQHSLARVHARDTVRLASWHHLLVADPLFESPGQQRFTLRADSPARGRALRAVSRLDSVDLFGVKRARRPGNADLGAIEFVEGE